MWLCVGVCLCTATPVLLPSLVDWRKHDSSRHTERWRHSTTLSCSHKASSSKYYRSIKICSPFSPQRWIGGLLLSSSCSLSLFAAILVPFHSSLNTHENVYAALIELELHGLTDRRAFVERAAARAKICLGKILHFCCVSAY